MPQLDIDRLLANPNAKIRLLHPSGLQWTGLRQDELMIGGQAEYSNPFETHMQEQNLKWNSLGSVISQGLESAGLPQLPTITLTTKEQTLHQWAGSQRPQVPVTMTLIRTDMSKPSVTNLASLLIAKTMPSGDGAVATLLKAPGGYKPTGSEKGASSAGTWTVHIGQFFRADKLVLTSAQASFSEATVSDGTPLMAMVQATFEPIMILTDKEFERWFLK